MHVRVQYRDALIPWRDMVPKKADIKYFMHQISLLVAFKQGSEPLGRTLATWSLYDHFELTNWRISGCGCGRGVNSCCKAGVQPPRGHGNRSWGALCESIDLDNRSIDSVGVNKQPCSGPRGVN